MVNIHDLGARYGQNFSSFNKKSLKDSRSNYIFYVFQGKEKWASISVYKIFNTGPTHLNRWLFLKKIPDFQFWSDVFHTHKVSLQITRFQFLGTLPEKLTAFWGRSQWSWVLVRIAKKVLQSGLFGGRGHTTLVGVAQKFWPLEDVFFPKMGIFSKFSRYIYQHHPKNHFLLHV